MSTPPGHLPAALGSKDQQPRLSPKTGMFYVTPTSLHGYEPFKVAYAGPAMCGAT